MSRQGKALPEHFTFQQVYFGKEAIIWGMRINREVKGWFLTFVLGLIALIAYLLFFYPPAADYSSNFAWMFDSGPSFFATIAVASFFLLLRFFVQKHPPPSTTKFRYVGSVLLVLLVIIFCWEVVMLVLYEQRGFRPGSLFGGLLASLVILILWLFLRARASEKKNTPLSSNS